MSALSPASVLRSLNRYVTQAMGVDWEVRWAVEEGDFRRPFVRVSPSTPVQSTAVGPVRADLRRTFAIVCFPNIAPSEDEAQMEANRVEETLLVAFSKGIHVPSYSRHSDVGHPMRVPLWDYADVALDESIEQAEARLGRSLGPLRYARVDEPPTVHGLPDPVEDRAYIVTADIRLRWLRSVAEPLGGPLAEDVGGRPVPPPP